MGDADNFVKASVPKQKNVVKELKPSGIKAPSKIGRPCFGHTAPKTGPPPLEQKSEEALNFKMRRRYDDEFNKSYLADVCEENEADLLADRLTRSSISPDALNSKPPRGDRNLKNDPYMEATGRRNSDHGIILTNDTDSFIIGQRVWVAGLRPGQIAYIGETHFAPGDWAGVVLDQPNGKNDGCVSGKRYFQCEPKKGIFSRLTRLTHEPLPGAYDSKEPSPGRRSETPELSRTTSPTFSTRSTGFKTNKGMAIGDRVIVSSGYGSRPGILRYIGETKFAAGNWCGVHLDEPTGKNDGSVDGFRYFDCEPNYGVFVPIAKVSLSPSSKKAKMSRAVSKESLNSINTLNSVATTNTSRLRANNQKQTPLGKPLNASKVTYSLQDIIKEKQNHIEQLMIERELVKEDASNQNLSLQKNINELKNRNNDLEKELLMEKKKMEDLQSRMDEATFCGDELNAQAQVFRERIIELENEIQERAVNNLTNSSTCVVSEKEFKNIKEENKIFISKIESLEEKIVKNSEDFESKLANILENEFSLKQNVKYLTEENQRLKNELLSKDESIEKLYLDIKHLQNSFQEETTVLQKSIQTFEAKNLELKKECNDKNCKIEKLLKDLEVLQNSIEDKSLKTQNWIIEKNNLTEQCLQNETKLKEFENVIKQNETMINDLSTKLDESQVQYEKVIDELKFKTADSEELKIKIKTKETEIADLYELKCTHEKNLKELVEKLQSQTQIASDISSLEMKLFNQKEENQTNKNLIEDLKKEIIALKTKAQDMQNENEVLIRQNEQNEDKLTTLQAELNDKTSRLEASEVKHKAIQSIYDNLKKDFEQKTNDYKQFSEFYEKEKSNFKAEVESLQILLNQNTEKHKQATKLFEEEIITLKKSINESQCLIETKSNEIKSTMLEKDNQILQLLKEIDLSKISLQNSEKENQNLRAEFEDIKTKLSIAQENSQGELEKFNQLKLDFNSLSKKNEMLQQKCVDYLAEIESLKGEINSVRTTSSDIDSEVAKLSNTLSSKQKDLDELIESSSAMRIELERKIEEMNLKYDASQNKIEVLENDAREREILKSKIIQQTTETVEGLVQKYNNEITNLKEEFKLKIAEFTTENETRTSACTELQTLATSLQNELKLRQEKTQLQDETNAKRIQELCREKELIEKALENSNNNLELTKRQLEEDIKLKDNEISQIVAERIKLSEEINFIKLELESAKSNELQLTELESQRVSLENDKELIKKELEISKNNEENTKKLIESKIEEMAKMDAENAKLTNELCTLKLQFASVEKNLLSLQEELQMKSKDASQREEEKVHIIETLNKQFKELEEHQVDIVTENEDLRKEIHSLIAKSNTLNDVINKITLENKQLIANSNESSQFNDVIKNFQSRTLNLEETLNKKNFMLEETTKQLIEQKNEIAMLRKQIIENNNTNTKCAKCEDNELKMGNLEKFKNASSKIPRQTLNSVDPLSNDKEINSCNSLAEKHNIIETDINKKEQKNHSESVDKDMPNYVGQIAFLNSIIADMQKKNEELTARFEAYKNETIDFTKPNAFDIKIRKLPAPRAFCDICDEFDNHETEDCPIQSSDSPTPSSECNKEKKLPPPRKYCESCEVFGHEKGECDDEEVY